MASLEEYVTSKVCGRENMDMADPNDSGLVIL